jgi:hypothetical protein
VRFMLVAVFKTLPLSKTGSIKLNEWNERYITCC